MTKLTNRIILEAAMRQSAIDASCTADDFLRSENVIVTSERSPEARKYLELPFDCNLISYGNNIVASINENYRSIVERYISELSPYRCFETPAINILGTTLQKQGLKLCFMAEYFLPDVEHLCRLSCPYTLRIMESADFAPLYHLPEWSNALCEKRKELDVLGGAAYDGNTLVGLAACSADCNDMWQIGVDVLPEYRRRGIASALTSSLALEILGRGKIPFYCAAWSNIKSVRNAIKSGFRPAWIELTAKSAQFTDEICGISL